MSIVVPPTGEPAEPEKRRPFRQADIDAAMIRQDGRCATCGEANPPFEADHDNPRDLLGKTDLANLRLRCVPCHAAKTKIDRRNIAKAARIRRTLAGEKKPGPKMKSAGFRRDPLSWRNA